MTKLAKPFSIKLVIAVGLSIVLAFALLSFFFLFVQARSGTDRIVGEVVTVEAHYITIIDARGRTTTLIVPADAHLRGVDAISDLFLGQLIMTRGAFVDDAVFQVEGLRIVED